MSACLTDLELAALTGEAAASPPTPAQQEHLLGCERCRAQLLRSFRERAHLTLPDHESIAHEAGSPASTDETAPVASSARLESNDVPASSDRYGLRAAATAGPEVLGRGGYGKLLLARDLAVGRDVALKCLRSKVVASAQRAQDLHGRQPQKSYA